MLLNSVILLLREVLEAAVLVSVLMAFSALLRQGVYWLLCALPVALVGTFWFAAGLEQLTDALDGAGQEVINAALQFSVYLLLLLIVGRGVSLAPGATGKKPGLQLMMAAAVSCAMVREGSEIVVYIAAFAAAEEQRTAVYAGSAIGAGIGVSLGVLLYHALRSLPPLLAWRSCLLLLVFIGAGMVMQATMLLEQVDWLPGGDSLWDSSALVREQSITGELLYAVFGYESSPSAIQVLLYGLSLSGFIIAALVARRSRERVDENC